MAIVVRIDQNGMEAVVDMDRQSDQPVYVDSVLHALAEAGITHGVDPIACHELVESINLEPPGSKLSRTIARGVVPIEGENGAVEMAVEYTRSIIGKAGDFGTIDFHERGSYTPIALGQLIAKIKPPTAGTAGKDVRGNEIKTTPGNRARLTAGQGTKIEAGGTELRAARHGDLRCLGDVIEVMDIIKVSGSLDYAVGSIECDGPVRVEGDVLPGFHIRAGGDVFVGGVVEGAEITAGGSLVVGQGILGGSRICAKDKLTTGYVRESYLECDGNIGILKEAVNSTVVSGDSIAIPESGRVVGGRLLALNNIAVGSVGNPKGVLTTLAVGVSPLKELRAAKLASDIQRAEGTQKRIARMKGLASPDQHEALDRILSAAASKSEIHTRELEALQANTMKITDCRIHVKNDVYPGARICVGKGEMAIRDERHNTIFYYDADSGQVVQITKGG